MGKLKDSIIPFPVCSIYGLSDTTFSPAEIPFFYFPAKGSMKNPYKDAMVDDF